MSLIHHIATSDSLAGRWARRLYRMVQGMTIPAPRVVVRPILRAFVATRATYYFLWRILVCEPLFKAYCTSYGKSLHTGVYIHFVVGHGYIRIGDDVTIDGKCSILFAARHSAAPTLAIGDRTYIGHNVSFSVSKSITIGDHCLVAANVAMFDSNGHPTDPDRRRAGEAPANESVRPISIGDNVWIGQRALILPGVTIGENSIVSAASLVRNDVPPNCIVAGNPATIVKRLKTKQLSVTDADWEQQDCDAR